MDLPAQEQMDKYNRLHKNLSRMAPSYRYPRPKSMSMFPRIQEARLM